jgi:hypothetical protein
MQECDQLATCGFFQKYQNTKQLACRGFINQYCRGGKMAQCKRLAYKREHGEEPPDDMMPSGHMVAPSRDED